MSWFKLSGLKIQKNERKQNFDRNFWSKSLEKNPMKGGTPAIEKMINVVTVR